MKRTLLIAAAAFALAACGQSTAEKTEEAAPAAPADMKSQVEAMGPEERGVFAYTQLIAYHQANPTVTPQCTSLRRVDDVGVIPANVRPDSVYQPHVGALVYSVQCGPQLTTVADDPREHWMVVFAPGAAAASFYPCADESGRRSRCTRTPLTVSPEATQAATPAPATTP